LKLQRRLLKSFAAELLAPGITPNFTVANRSAQVLFAVAALIAALLALAIPFPPFRSSEESALVRLGVFFVLATITAVALSVRPRAGRYFGLILGVASLGQLLVTIVGATRTESLAPMPAAIGLSPWLIATVAGALLLRQHPRNVVLR
jgi:magnesium-transporting ATPase (P-type)